MNVRISRDQLRFRITQDDLARLNSGELLEQSTVLPGNRVFQMTIHTVPDGTVPLKLDYDGQQMALAVDAHSARVLLESPPSKQGIEVMQEVQPGQALLLQLEVDVRSRDRGNKHEPRTC